MTDLDVFKIALPVVISVIASVYVTAWRFGVRLSILEIQLAHANATLAKLEVKLERASMESATLIATERLRSERQSRPDV